MKGIVVIAIAVLAILAMVDVPSARALPTITFYGNLTQFNTAAGSPPIVVNFDDITPGTDITNQTIGGLKFEPNLLTVSAPLVVVRANDTYSPSGFSWAPSPNNKLFATSGENVLSPGGPILAPGPNATVENDDLTLTFTSPVAAVGFDVLFQSLDGNSYAFIKLLDASNNTLYPSTMIATTPAPNYDGGTVFVGFVSNSSSIQKIIIDETDANNQYIDCNLGIDTIRLSYQPIPEFQTNITAMIILVTLTGALLFAKKNLAPVSKRKKQ